MSFPYWRTLSSILQPFEGIFDECSDCNWSARNLTNGSTEGLDSMSGTSERQIAVLCTTNQPSAILPFSLSLADKNQRTHHNGIEHFKAESETAMDG